MAVSWLMLASPRTACGFISKLDGNVPHLARRVTAKNAIKNRAGVPAGVIEPMIFAPEPHVTCPVTPRADTVA
jgi:hypothetical protein